MNPWYRFTYEAILSLADWQKFDADVDKKIVGIYSWMPQTIMRLRMTQRRVRCNEFSIEDVTHAASESEKHIPILENIPLQKFDSNEMGNVVRDVAAPLFEVLGGVASAKYLHFSRPYLFPMWDRRMRIQGGFPDSPEGYIGYMEQFKLDIEDEGNIKIALDHYHKNIIRGWDMEKMRRRDD